MNRIISLSLLVLLSFNVEANWQLKNEQSSINFISIKKSSAGELHNFRSLAGTLNGGKATVTIDLSSVDTNIPVRDDRMKSMLFEISKFSEATIAAEIDESKLEKMQKGDYYQADITLSLSLHGVTKELASTVQVVKLSDNNISVSSKHPVIINASDFNLDDGIEALRAVAKLPSISSAVPVTFNLIFTQ